MKEKNMARKHRPEQFLAEYLERKRKEKSVPILDPETAAQRAIRTFAQLKN